MKKMYFIYNPTSGKSTVNARLFKIIDRFTKAGYDVTVRPTQMQYDARETVKRICLSDEKCDLIVCSGGDGTLNEVIHGLMVSKRKIPLGYIPTGTTNDFAKSLTIPKTILKAADSIIDGNIFPCDIGSFNERYFTYVAAFGAFTEVSYETPQQVKNKLGHAAYILGGLKQLTSIKSYELTVECNDTTISGEFIYGMVSNTASIAGLISTGDFKLDDGLYEAMLIRKPKSLGQLKSIVSSILNIKEPINTEYVTFFKTNHVEVHAKDNMPWTIDGEFGGDDRNISIYNNTKALDLMIKYELKKA